MWRFYFYYSIAVISSFDQAANHCKTYNRQQTLVCGRPFKKSFLSGKNNGFAETIYCNHGRIGNATFSCGFAVRSNGRCHTIIKVDCAASGLIWYIDWRDTKLDHDDPCMNAHQRQSQSQRQYPHCDGIHVTRPAVKRSTNKLRPSGHTHHALYINHIH